MSTLTTETLTGRELVTRIWKYSLRRVLFPVGVLAPFAYFFPKVALVYAVCGAYDIGRNRGLTLSALRRYFIGNGFPTWLLSPVNTLLDLLSLPVRQQGRLSAGRPAASLPGRGQASHPDCEKTAISCVSWKSGRRNFRAP